MSKVLALEEENQMEFQKGNHRKGVEQVAESETERGVYDSSFVNDWPQAKDFWRTTNRNVTKTLPRMVVDVSLEQLEREKRMKFPVANLRLVNTSAVVVAKDGAPLVYFLKGGLGWPFVNRDPSKQGLEALQILKETYPPPPPKSTDVRHLDHLHGTRQGAYHFALWHATGHRYDQENEGKLAGGATISKDTIQSGGRLNATMEFFHRFTPVTQAVGALFDVIDPIGYKTCKAKFDELARNTAVSMLKVSSRSCFLGMAILAGLSCLPHRDDKDSKTAWIADMAFGHFEGGLLEVPQVGFEFELRQGDVIFMKSALLQHSVSKVTKGYRFGVVYFSHESIGEKTLESLTLDGHQEPAKKEWSVPKELGVQ